jgi:hypothetical protein
VALLGFTLRGDNNSKRSNTKTVNNIRLPDMKWLHNWRSKGTRGNVGLTMFEEQNTALDEDLLEVKEAEPLDDSGKYI